MNDSLKGLVKAAVTGNGMTKEESALLGRMLFTYGWRASAFVFALWSLGTFNTWGFGKGFVYADDADKEQTQVEGRLTNVEHRLTTIELRQLEQDIMTTLKERCAAPSKDYFRQRLNDLQKQYSAGNRDKELPLPTCTELGISPK
jgi:hypothetical protein